MEQDVKRRKTKEILELLAKVNMFQKLETNQFRELATAAKVWPSLCKSVKISI